MPSLADYDFVAVFEVADLSRYDWKMLVSYSPGRPFDLHDEQRLVSLGGKITARWLALNALAGVLPDRSFSALRSEKNVRIVQASAPFCPD
ncbi:MAG TPA: hypothetical protein VJ717_20345 [Gemmatimonadaceae bacterium]|nr:hypothetical protein [Gemmatimonadaceae bacterium]